MDTGNSEFDKLLQLHEDVKDFKLKTSKCILMNYHYFNPREGPKFKLTYDEYPPYARANVSATTICACAISQYIDLWIENDISIENCFKPLKNYYKYIIDRLSVYLDKTLDTDRDSSNEFHHLNTSTDEFVILNILSHLKMILNKIRIDEKNNDWSYGTEKILDIIDLLYEEYCRDNKKLKYKDDTHPFIYYAFKTILLDWKKELLCRKNSNISLNDFNRIIDEIYDKGKYEMYRQMALYKSNDRSLFDAKRLIYSLLIVTIGNRYSNDKIKKEVLSIIFNEQLETGLWPIGNIINVDFALERGRIKRESFRIIAMSRILSSVECLNDMLLHDNINEDLETYLPFLDKTYNWITNRLREREVDMFPLLSSRDIPDPVDVMIDIEDANFNSYNGIYDELITNVRMMFGNLRSDVNRAKKNEIKKYLADELNKLYLNISSEDAKNLIFEDPSSNEISITSKPDFLRKFREPFINDIIDKNSKKESFNIPLGWYPEYEGNRESKSWVAGHTLLFLIKYCELISRLIEKRSMEYLQASDSRYLKGSWDTLRSSYKIKQILRNMISDSRESNPEYRSAFIFGPPGTGKSSIARTLARELGWNYVEITPGQFLEEGETNIIRKASSLFKRLSRMRNTVIFFDEVDQFLELRKKDSRSSSKWVLTSLLPKFQELHNQKDIKFILATNKIDEIDMAMRRRGRVDFVLPMGAICWRDRAKMLRDEIKNLKKYKIDPKNLFPELFFTDNGNIKDNNAINRLKKRNISSEELKKFLIKTDFMLFPDIIDLLGALKDVIKTGQNFNPLYKFIFMNKSSEYLRYTNRDLASFHIISLSKSRDENIQLPPTLRAKIDMLSGFESIVDDNSFSSLLLCEGDIKDFDMLLEKISDDTENSRECNLSFYIHRISKNHETLSDYIKQYKQVASKNLNEELKKYIKKYLDIDIACEELRVDDIESLKNKLETMADVSERSEIKEKIQKFYELSMLKNSIIMELNQIMDEDDLSSDKYVDKLDKKIQKYVRDTKKEMNNPDGEISQVMKKMVNRLILEGTYCNEISNILKCEIEISGMQGYLRKYTDLKQTQKF